MQSAALLYVLRPRFTLSYILLCLFTLYMTHRLLTSRPMLASPLPPYSKAGPYDVAAVDIEVPLDSPQRVSDITFKATGEPAFEVETVLFTLYYPTQRGSTTSQQQYGTDKLYWIPKPISATATGYARFLGADNFILRPLLTFGLWLVAGDITIPARIGAPLLSADDAIINNTTTTTVSENGTLPVMVFSHGMLSSRTDYTAYLGSLASRGIVVAALEHRDGSSPGSCLAAAAAAAATPRLRSWRYYFGLRDLDPMSFSAAAAAGEEGDEKEGRRNSPDKRTAALKQAQLAFRTAEINAAVSVLRDLNTRPAAVHEKNARAAAHFDPTLFASRLNTSFITLAGHSYGGTGALQALSSSSSTSSPFAGAVILDPGKSSGPLNADVSVPLVICHSASWSRPGASLFYGRPHFEVVREIAEGVNERCDGGGVDVRDGACQDKNNARGWFLTSLGTSHPSITDAPLLEPLLLSWTTGSTMDAADGIAQYVDVTEDLVRYQHTGTREGLLGLSGKTEDGVVSKDYDPARNMGMPERWRKYWQVHVAPD
ncbi:hypothetical protein N0V82_000626 [Gnomoniopsis sp. IMI 355080]|nr:hypothetical protein N0V82_000626 [Gnomoniopsis sp. IMI 355080]